MPESFQKALLIINPASRSGNEAELDLCVDLLLENSIKVSTEMSSSPQDTDSLIRKHAHCVDFFILAGGDGTIHSAAEALLDTKSVLAVFPMGTANDFARSLNISEQLSEACKVIINNYRRQIDLAQVENRYFFNVAHIGLGVQITRELTPEIKKSWGVLSYFRAFISAIRRKKRFKVKVHACGQRHKFKSIHLAIGNGRYYGGGNLVDEESKVDDGLLRFFSIKPQPVWAVLTMAPYLRGGTHRKARKTFCFSAPEARIETSKKMEIHADGEPVASTPATFKVLHKAISVIAPKPEGPEAS